MPATPAISSSPTTSILRQRRRKFDWADWNANNRATFIVDKTGKVRFVERYGKGELPDPDKILGEVAKIN